jgi:hypothetical protein
VAPLLQARYPGEAELVIVHNEHAFSPTPIRIRARGPRWIVRLSQISVGNGLAVRKPLCQFELPNGVK